MEGTSSCILFKNKVGTLACTPLQNSDLMFARWFHPSCLTFGKCITAAFDNKKFAGLAVCFRRIRFLIRKGAEEKVLEGITISQYLWLITVFWIFFYTAYRYFGERMKAFQKMRMLRFRPSKNNWLCTVDVTDTDRAIAGVAHRNVHHYSGLLKCAPNFLFAYKSTLSVLNQG